MKKFLLFLFAIAALPVAWGVVPAFKTLFATLEMPSGAFLSSEGWAIVSGIAAWSIIWCFFPPPVKLYVFGHEATHALIGKLFGAKASRLKVGESGGSVTLSKSNVWITLSPYFVPFYTVLTVAAAAATRLFTHSLPCPFAWITLGSFTWAMHLFFTIHSLCRTQPDVEEYGRLFSWLLIFLFNALEAALFLAILFNAPLGAVFQDFAGGVKSAYEAIYSLASRLAEN